MAPRLGGAGFPCDQFGHQEPGDEAEIKNFCSLSYDVSFPLFAKIDVNGNDAHPLWKWLKDEKGGFLGIDAIKWNFSKFLVGRDGQVLKRYAPTDKPESIAADIEAALGWPSARTMSSAPPLEAHAAGRMPRWRSWHDGAHARQRALCCGRSGASILRPLPMAEVHPGYGRARRGRMTSPAQSRRRDFAGAVRARVLGEIAALVRAGRRGSDSAAAR